LGARDIARRNVAGFARDEIKEKTALPTADSAAAIARGDCFIADHFIDMAFCAFM
jgi:hypothetical protein